MANLSSAVPLEALDPSNLYITFPKIWEDFIEVSWGRQLFNGKKTLKYQMTATAKSYRVERFFTGSEHTFRLVGLLPGSDVQVQVRSLTESGDDGPSWSPWATGVASTLKGVETTVASVNSDRIHGKLTWGGAELVARGPTPTHTVVPAAHFDIKVRERGTFLTSDYCERQCPPDATQFVIENVPASTIFEVTVRAVSAFGDVGHWSSPVRFLSLNPVDLSVMERGEDYALVTWSRKDEEKFLPSESAIEELVFIVELLPSQRELDVDAQARKIQVDAQTFSNETRKYRLRSLLPGRTYSIRSRYRNALGDWTQWSTMKLATLCPVRLPDAQIVGHNFIQVSWQRSEPEDGNAFESAHQDVQLWEIRCTVGKAATTMQLPVHDTETKLTNLLPGVDYTVDVRAQTTAGEWGLWSEALTVTTLHKLKCRVEFTGETWIKVDWGRREKQYLDNITRYHVQLHGTTSAYRVAKYFPATTTSYTFENLKTAMPFHITIQAFSDQRWGPWSEPTEASTCAPCLPQLIRRGEDFVQLRWNCEYYNNVQMEQMDRKYQVKLFRPRIEDELSSKPVGPAIVVTEDVATNTYRVPRLPAFSRISIQVRCFDYCLNAWCDWGPEREFRTLPAAMVLTHVGETSVELSWARRVRVMSAVTDEDEQRGEVDPLAPTEVLKYIIRLSNVDQGDQLREHSKYHLDRTMPTTTAITDLSPDSEYALQLSYLDSDDVWSPLSAPLRFRTPPLMKITVLDVTEGACTLHWGRWSVFNPSGHRGGVTEPTAMDMQERAFRIIVTRVQGSEAPRQYNVADANRYTVRELLPSTLYKIQVSGALHSGAAWGYWSDPVYIFTTPAMQMDLTQVGEDYAALTWSRAAADPLHKLLPNAKVVVIATYTPDAPVKPQLSPKPEEGCPVYVGDSGVIEYHLQLFVVRPPPPEDPDAAPIRELFFESKLNSYQDHVRVPSLTASTNYETIVSACTKSKQWGSWSTPLRFSTSTPTEVRVAEITQDYVTVVWGNADPSSDRDVWKYQLRMQGHDDEFMKEVEFDSTVHQYELKNLSVNACYSVKLRRFLSSDKDWGQWSDSVFILVQSIPTEVVEVSQDWAHVHWVNKVPADRSIAKVQFLSLLGHKQATVIRLPAQDQSFIFNDLVANTLYTTHLLSIEQCASYQKAAGGEMMSSAKAGGTRGTTGNKTMELEGNVASFSIPVVNSEFRAYLAAGEAFRTHSPLLLSVERVGQNFALLRWIADRGEEGAGRIATSFAADEGSAASSQHHYEIECMELDSEVEAKRTIKASGSHVVVRGLKPDCALRFAVRSVAERSDAVCQWSRPATTRTLPMLFPVLGPGDGTDTPGIGEDYVMVHWGSQDVSSIAGKNTVGYDVRLTTLEGPDANTELIAQPLEPRHHFKGLRNDTRYRIEVRTRITLDLGTNQQEVIRGDWSAFVACATLSPMALAVSDIVEAGAVVHWRRRNYASAARWWVQRDPEETKAEIASISSFHVRITAVDTSTVVFDEQIAEHQEPFAKCSLPLKALSPCTRYAATVRSSTGMLWGAWSEPVTFQTSSPCAVKVLMIGEKFVAVEWVRDQRQQQQTGAEKAAEGVDDSDGAAKKPSPLSEVTVDAVVLHWEVAFTVVGTDAKSAQRTVLVDCEQTRHCIGGLESNTPYHVTVRPVYEGGATGQWSAPAYFVTMAPFTVDVGKVGETFVQVSWERARQETVQTRMRLKHVEVMRAMSAQLEELQRELSKKQDAASNGPKFDGDEQAAVGVDDEQPVGAEALMSTGSTGGGGDHEGGTPTSGDQKSDRDPTAELTARIDALQQKMSRRQKLSTLQIADLERNAAYPNGEDTRYELMVFGGASDGEEQPFLFRRRLGRGELHCRLEGLQPKTIYEVTVRSLYSNGLSMSSMATSDIGDVAEEGGQGLEATEKTPWGPWSDRTRFATLKPIVTKAKSIGSECIAVEWDTGGMGSEDGDGTTQRTAITKFQLHVTEPKAASVPKAATTGQGQGGSSAAAPAPEAKQRPILTLEDPSLKGYVVGGLQPNHLYAVTVRVCYEGDKWGVWSTPVTFMTMPRLLSKLQRVSERQLEFLVWRDQQLPPPEGHSTAVVWRPQVTEHQLAINGMPCSQTFSLEANTSTLLTLDTLSVDTEYAVSVKDRVEDYWQDFNVVLQCETIAYAPQRPTLRERKGPNVVIAWQHRQNLAATKQYLYCVEMALRDGAEKKRMSDRALQRSGHSWDEKSTGQSGNSNTTSPPVLHGNYEVLGYTSVMQFRMVLPHPIHDCFFRVRVCKTSQTTDGEPQPLVVNPLQPQAIPMDHPQQYVWSNSSAVAHFKTPSVPDHPTGLHITDLTHNRAILRWNRPTNHKDHTQLIYRVYLNNSYQERFSCLGETPQTSWELQDLIPNCHYRVAVSAESSMGTSVQNNTLHFSTRVTPAGGAAAASAASELLHMQGAYRKSKPLTSTLPPRTQLKAPHELLESVRRKGTRINTDDGANGFTALLDDTASTVFTAARLTQQRRSPPSDADGTGRPSSASQQRHRLLPPLHQDANASV